MTQRPSFLMLSRPLATRIGAPLIALLSTITVLTGFAAVTVTIGAPSWVLGSWSMPVAVGGIGLALGLATRPRRTTQPRHARAIAAGSVVGGVTASLTALMSAAATPGCAWGLIAATAVEATWVVALSTWVATHRRR